MAEGVCVFCGRAMRIKGHGLCGACYERKARNGTPEYVNLYRRDISDPADPRHGTVNAYRNLRCRCDRCRAANTASCAQLRTERPDLDQARRVRASASRIPRGVPAEMRSRMAEERAELALRHASEMDKLIQRQRAEAVAWIDEMRLESLRERLTAEEARLARLRERLGEIAEEGARGD